MATLKALKSLLLAGTRLEARSVRLRGTERILRLLYHPSRREGDYVAYAGEYRGALFQVDTRNSLEWYLHVYGGYEEGAVALLTRLCHPGAVVLDVGANVGTFTVPLARAAGPAGRVHAFEPHPAIRQRLAENVALNNLRNVVVAGCALGDRPGTAELYGPHAENQGTASLRPLPEAAPSARCRVETLDGYVQSAGLERVDLIKSDTEGAELLMLHGAAQTLRTHRPCLYVEVSGPQLARFGATPQDVATFLRRHGYLLWRDQTTFQGKVHLLPVPEQVRDADYGVPRNWLAVHPGSVPVVSAVLADSPQA